MPTPQSSQKRKTTGHCSAEKVKKNSAFHAMRLSIRPAIALVIIFFFLLCFCFVFFHKDTNDSIQENDRQFTEITLLWTSPFQCRIIRRKRMATYPSTVWAGRPDVVVGIFALLLLRLLEPSVVSAGLVWHKVQDHSTT